MAIHDFQIGTGPDYVMTMGKIRFAHRAQMELAFDNSARTKFPVTNPSLKGLIDEVLERLMAIGWSKEEGVLWLPANFPTASARGKIGSAVMRFRFPAQMPQILEGRIIPIIQESFQVF